MIVAHFHYVLAGTVPGSVWPAGAAAAASGALAATAPAAVLAVLVYQR